MSGQEQVLRTGVLFKKGSGAGPFGRRNWKPRYFVLTPHKLQYYTFEDGDLKGEVDLSGCDENVLEVMPADSMKTGSSASTIWRVAINTPSRRLLVAAGTEMEMNDWVDKLVLAFRISSGQQPPPDQVRASMYTPGDARVVAGQAGNNNPVITDFQNFAAARRSVAVNMNRHSVGSHHSVGAADVARHSDVDGMLLVHADQLHEQQQRQREEEAAARHQQEMEAQQQHEAAEAAVRVREAEAAAAAAAVAAEQEERRRQEQAEEARLSQERLEQQRLENERLEQERRERERQERIEQEEARKKAVHDKLLEDEMAMTGSFKQQDQTEALLELQRRQKREEHERIRRESQQRAIEAQALAEKQEADLIARQQELAAAAEDPLERQRCEKREKREREQRERAERLAAEQQQQKADFDDLEFRMTAQMNSQQAYFDVDNESDSDSDEEFALNSNSVHANRHSQPERSPELAPAPVAIERVSLSSDTPAPRSSLIGDVKVETMRKQQAEHQRRREHSLQQEKYKLELEQQRAQLEAVTLSQHQHFEQQDVTIARGMERGEVEVVRRPVKASTGASPPAPRVMDSVEF